MKICVLALNLGLFLLSCSQPTESPSDHPIDHAQLTVEEILPPPRPVLEASAAAVPRSPRIVLYGNPHCSLCVAAERALAQKNLPYEFIDVYKDSTTLPKLRETVGKKRFPYVFVDDTYLGGLSELKTFASTLRP